MKVGDKVWWNYPNGGMDYGVVEKIYDDHMSIYLPLFKDCKVFTGAKRVDRQWLVHCPYQGYILTLKG